MHTLSLNGGLAPLAATTWLGSQGFFVEPGANLYRGRGQIGELDLLGWKGSELVAGEAKTSRAGFSYADISRDVALAASTGADSYLAVCLEELPEDIRSQLDSACESSDELSPR
jgi:hypothetical protein